MKVTLFTRMEQDSLLSLRKSCQKNLIKDNEVILVHLLKYEAYSFDFLAAYYPTESQLEALTSSMQEVLEEEKRFYIEAGAKSFKAKVITTPLPKTEAIDFIKENKVDLAITTARTRDAVADLFYSSFNHGLCTHAPCDVYMLREN